VKAVLHTQYGSPDLLELREVDRPTPKANEVLIAIHATSVSTGDCNVRNFTFVTKSMRPIEKLMFGIGKPWKERVLGTELAGEVEGAGKDVTRFKTGDRVVASTGTAGGGHAQYACLPGATVTGVCSGANVELVKSLGADTMIDYTSKDFTKMENATPDIRRRRDDV